MKKFEIFGISISFRIDRKNKDDAEIYTEEHHLREKIFYLMMVVIFIILSSKIYYLSRKNTYSVGDVVVSDIYSPKSTTYNDRDKRENIIKRMILNSEKEYIYVPDAEKIYLEGFNDFFDQLLLMKKEKKKIYDSKVVERLTGRKVSQDMVENLLKCSTTQLEKKRENLSSLLEIAYKNGITQEKGLIYIKPPINKEIEDLPQLDKKVIYTFLTGNYIYDEGRTKEAIKEKISQVGDQITEIKAGTLLAKKGEILTEKKINMLEAVGIYSYRRNIFMLIGNFIYLVIISTIFYPILINVLKKYLLNKNYYRSTFLVMAVTFLVFRFVNIDYIYLLPFDLFFFLLSILVDVNYSFIMSLFALGYLVPIIDYDLVYVVIYIFSLIIGGYLIKKVATRAELINIGLKLSVLKFSLFILMSYFLRSEGSLIALKSGELILSGILSGMMTIAVLPYFEKTFNILTIFKLLELGDLSHPLLKMLSVKAPGTFHHSMMVATLSETAAEAIGANAVFARVASYYHDIGKTKRAKFYVENQEGGENPHSKISPFLSSLIIGAHTRDGAELAKEYKIPREIRDIMYEHQGTTLLAYFFNKAKQLEPNVQEEEFRYSGPKPKSKESAIIMLADSIEAAVRSLDEKTPVTIENMLRRIINAKIEDNQLSEADLTFKEIEIIIKTFTKVLMSIHHVRIKYPGQKEK
ncbi:MAG: HD family phosphohydrolase [Cetobacterium sp.]